MEAEKRMAVVHYQDFGARGDGVSDDIDAIAKAHAFANEHGLSVRADDNATYHIGGKKKITVVIQTDTDFGSAKFMIDDTDAHEEDRPEALNPPFPYRVIAFDPAMVRSAEL